MIERNLRISSNKETNLFLRCLWAQVRSKYPDMRWGYSPKTIGAKNLYYAGEMYFGDEIRLGVRCQYKKRGVINKIIFNKRPLSRDINLEKIFHDLDNCIDKAMVKYNFPLLVAFETKVNFGIRKLINPYCGGNWKINSEPNGDNFLSIHLSCFDDYDGMILAGDVFQSVLDFFSICTNTPSSFDTVSVTNDRAELNSGMLFFEDDDWIDGEPILNGNLSINEYQARIITRIVNGDEVVLRFSKSWRHFHDALKIRNRTRDYEDLSVTLIMSSLEAISIFKFDKLEKCDVSKREIGGIKSRVFKFVEQYSGEPLGVLVKKFYDKRSKFLHVGDRNPFFGKNGLAFRGICPTIMVGEDHGFLGSSSTKFVHLHEFASHSIRKYILECEQEMATSQFPSSEL